MTKGSDRDGRRVAGGRVKPDRFSWRVLWHDVPAPVWWFTAVLGFLLLLATLLYPPYRGPDEPQHVDLAVALERGETSPLWEPGERLLSPGVAAAELVENRRTADPVRLADRDLVRRGERVSFDEALAAGGSDRGNQLVQHPPGYYLLLAGALRLLPGWERWDFETVVAVLRLVNLLLVLPLPLIAHAAARRASANRTVGVVGAGAVLAVPQLVHIGSSVNNDNLAVLATALWTLLTLHILAGDSSLRTAFWVGLTLGIGLQSKGLLLVLVPLLIAVYVVLGWRTRSPRVLGALVTAGGVSGVIGGWWWLRNWVRYGTPQPDGAYPGGVGPPAEDAAGWSDGGPEWVRSFAELFVYRFFFDDPSGEAPFGTAWVLAAGAAIVGGLLLLVVFSSRTATLPGGIPLADRLLIFLPLPLIVAIVASGSWDSFVRGLPLAAMQGRYAFPAICGLAVLVALGLYRVTPVRWRPALPALILLVALTYQLLAVLTTLRLYWWSPSAGPLGTARAFVDAAPWPASFVMLVVLSAAGTALGALLAVARLSLTGHGSRQALPTAPVRPAQDLAAET